MSILASVTLSSSEVSGVLPVPLSVTIENGSGEEIFVEGIKLLTDNEAVATGDFQRFFPLLLQSVSGGSPVTSSIPKYGTGEQSSQTIVGDPLFYYVGNISGSSLVTSSFIGLHIPSGSQTIADGATGSFQSSVVPVRAPFLPSQTLTTNISTLAVVSGSSGGLQIVTSSAESLSIKSKEVERIACSLVGASAITSKSKFARRPAFSNFDAFVQTDIVYIDGTQITLTPGNANGITSDFTSSDPSVVSVVQSGLFGSTTGSIVNGVAQGNSQFTAGAGALTFTFPSNNNPDPAFATISNRVDAGLTGSVLVGLQEFAITGMFIQPNLLSIVSGTTVELDAYFTLDNGELLEAADPVGEPTWSSSNSNAVAISVSGSITGSADVQAQVLITATGGGQTSSATVILNKII